jgi:hypothetical protein
MGNCAHPENDLKLLARLWRVTSAKNLMKIRLLRRALFAAVLSGGLSRRRAWCLGQSAVTAGPCNASTGAVSGIGSDPVRLRVPVDWSHPTGPQRGRPAPRYRPSRR